VSAYLPVNDLIVGIVRRGSGTDVVGLILAGGTAGRRQFGTSARRREYWTGASGTGADDRIGTWDGGAGATGGTCGLAAGDGRGWK